MKIKITSLSLVLVLLLLTPLHIASAKTSFEGISVPISGTFSDQSGIGRFSGTLTIVRFAVVNNGIQAVGAVTGTLTDSQGNVVTTGLQTVSLPITLTNGPAEGKQTPANIKRNDQSALPKHRLIAQSKRHSLPVRGQRLFRNSLARFAPQHWCDRSESAGVNRASQSGSSDH